MVGWHPPYACFFGGGGGGGLGLGALLSGLFHSFSLSRVGGGGSGFLAMSDGGSLEDTPNTDADRLAIVKEGFRQTELKLVELNRIAEAADRRAMAFTGFGGVIATLLISLAHDMPVQWVSYIGGALALFGSYRASMSALPRGFHTPGQLYDHWKDHLEDGDSLVEALEFRGNENDKRIKDNETSLKCNARILNDGVAIVIASAGLTAIGQLVGLAIRNIP